MMKIKQTDLEDLRSMEREARELEQEIFWREKVIRITSRINPVVVNNHKISDQTGDAAVSVADLGEVLAEIIDKINRKRISAERAIECLFSEERRIIRLYYFNGMSDREIAWKINFNEEVVGRKRRRAVERVTGEEYQYGTNKKT